MRTWRFVPDWRQKEMALQWNYLIKIFVLDFRINVCSLSHYVCGLLWKPVIKQCVWPLKILMLALLALWWSTNRESDCSMVCTLVIYYLKNMEPLCDKKELVIFNSPTQRFSVRVAIYQLYVGLSAKCTFGKILI